MTSVSKYFFSGRIMVAVRSAQLPTGSAKITSASTSLRSSLMALVKPSKLQQQQLPATSFTCRLACSNSRLSTSSGAWSLVISPTRSPLAISRCATSQIRVVLPAPRNPPAIISLVCFISIFLKFPFYLFTFLPFYLFTFLPFYPFTFLLFTLLPFYFSSSVLMRSKTSSGILAGRCSSGS